jgi:hypothetical protein
MGFLATKKPELIFVLYFNQDIYHLV